MKNITRRIIAIAALLCVAMSAFSGCSKASGSEVSDNTSSSSGEAEDEAPNLVYPFEVGGPEDDSMIEPDESILNGEDPTEAEESEETTESADEKNTDEAKSTEIVEATEADGQPATQIVTKQVDGETVTEVVKVTQIVEVTKDSKGYVASGGSTQNSGGNNNNNTETTAAVTQEAAAGNENSNYQSKTDGRYAMWLDISKDENFLFEGDFIHIKFKIKDNIPDGDYKVRISPDLSDVNGVAVSPGKVIDGIIRVNNGSIEPVDVSSETVMVFYGDNVAAKQGDTVDYYINVKNNSGLVAFNVWMYFDSNAMEFVSCEPSGEFAEVSKNETSVGEGGNHQMPDT